MADKKSFWEDAGRSGLIMGIIPIVYMLISMLVAKIPGENAMLAILAGVLDMLLWAAKFAFCIYMFKVCLKSYSAGNPEAGHDDVFKFGAATAFLSALIYAAFYLAFVLFIQPDVFTTAVETLKENPMMDANSLAMVENMIPKMPSISFFTQLIYCSIWGIVLSAIFSRNIPSDNPFSDDSKNN